MNVYVLDESHFPEDWRVRGVYSTREKAQAAAARHAPGDAPPEWRGPLDDDSCHSGPWSITPFEVDG